MKLTEHSKLRMKERAGLRYNEKNKLFREALSYGKSPNDIKDEKIKKFLLKKQIKSKVKLHKGYVFVYSKNGKKLYTMYKLPEEL